MFQFPGLPPPRLCVRQGGAAPACGGFAHSETPGSAAVCASPGTIAACRVLRRLPAPRHPPCAHGTFPRAPRAGPWMTVCHIDTVCSVRAILGCRIPSRRRVAPAADQMLPRAPEGARSCIYHAIQIKMENRSTHAMCPWDGLAPVPSRYAALKVRGAMPRGPETAGGPASPGRAGSGVYPRPGLHMELVCVSL